MLTRLRILLAAAALLTLTPQVGALPSMVFTGSLGIQTRPDFDGSGFGYTLSAYQKFDNQVLLGVQGGQGISGYPTAIPVLAAGYMRLPFGRVFVPVATGGLGYAFGPENATGYIWRAGGLFDIRNGSRSSLLLGCEYERFRNRAGLVVRGGVLLEL